MSARSFRLAASLAAALALVSCDESTGPSIGSPASLQVVSGDTQSDTVGHELPQPLVVKVLDDDGDPVPSAIVNFVVVAGGGRVFAGAAETNADGVAQERWTLGTSTADSQKVELRAVDATTGEPRVFGVFRAVALADAAVAIAIEGTAMREAAAGAAPTEPLAVRLLDRYGNPASGAPTWTVVDGGGTIVPQGGGTSDAGGIARAAWTLGPRVGAQRASASLGSAGPVTFDGAATAPAGLIVTRLGGDGQTGTVGEAVADSLRVRVTLPDGRPLGGLAVAFNTVAGTGEVSVPSVVTDADGRAATRFVLGSSVGAQSARATASVTVVEFTFDARPGAPATLLPHASPSLAAPGADVPVAFSVLDRFANRVAGVEVSFAVTGTSASVTNASAQSDAEGVVRTTLRVGTDVATYRVDATVPATPALPLSSLSIAVPSAPNPPSTALAAFDSAARRIRVSWTPVAAPPGLTTSYAVYWSTAAGVTKSSATRVAVAASPFDHLERPAGVTFHYRVASIGIGGEGPLSKEVSSTVPSSVGMSVLEPAAATRTEESVPVTVRILTSGAIASVTASTAEGARTSALTFSPGDGRWRGTLALAGLPRGELQVRIVARAATGDSAVSSVAIVIDRRPVVRVTAPSDEFVATPSLAVAATCEDDDPAGCASLQVRVGGGTWPPTLITSGTTGIDQTVSLAAFVGRQVQLDIVGQDSAGRTATVSRVVHVVAPTSGLVLKTQVTGRVFDLLGSRVLYAADSSGTADVRILDRTAGTDTRVQRTLGYHLKYGFLAPRGAIYVEGVTAGTVFDERVHEWRDGTDVPLGRPNASGSLRVSGGWAIWSQGSTLLRRDLENGVTNTISTNAGNWQNGVASNGDVAFWNEGYRVYRWRAGVVTSVSSSASLMNTWAETDGESIVWRRHGRPTTTGTEAQIMAWTPAGGEVPLTDLTSGSEPVPGNGYRTAGGWIAFQRQTAPTGVRQVWVRSPAGVETQLSAHATVSTLEALGPDGAVVYFNASQNARWLARPAASPIALPTNASPILRLEPGALLFSVGGGIFAMTY